MGAVTMGATGAREAAVTMVRFQKERPEEEPVPPDAAPLPGLIDRGPNPTRMKGWFLDPYDSKYDSMASHTLSDDPKYDEQFPSHPLSRVRRQFPEILDALEFSDDFTQ